MRSLLPAPSFGKKSGGALFIRCLALMFLMVTTVGLLSQQVQAADVPTGTIEGRVLNLSNGRYLGKALVKVEGTTIETLSNDFGEYTLSEVPAGTAKVSVFFTGQDPKTIDVTVEAGKTATQDFGLNQAKGVADDGTVILDAYVVAQQRYRNAQEIAVNEERQSTSIKSVVATDSLGHIPDGNIGEFVRFMPGVDVEYGGTYVNGADASAISVRGFGPENTAIMIDGMPISSPSPASLTRAVGLDMTSINNADRIEINKVATADMPANSPGGSINLITKSAFEYARPQLTLEAYVTVNTEDMSFFNKQPGPTNEKTYHTLPGGRLSVVVPMGKDMGLTFSLASDNKFQPNQRANSQWLVSSFSTDMRAALNTTTIGSPTVITNAQGTASLANPLLTRFQVIDNPWNTFKQSGNLRFDWRPFAGLTLKSNIQYSQYTGNNVSRRLEFRADRPADWGPDFVDGQQYIQRPINGTTYTTDGASRTSMTIDARDKRGDTRSGYIMATYAKGPWKIDSNVSRSQSKGRFDDMVNGHYSGLDLSLSNVGDVNFLGIKEGVPTAITVFRRDGTPYDYTKMANWTLDNASTLDAKSGEAFQKDIEDQFAFNIRRELDFLPWQIAFKTGVLRKVKDQAKWGRGTGYKTRYVGASAPYNVNLTAAALVDDVYKVSPGYGYPTQEWADVYKLYKLSQDHPEYFDENIIIANVTGNYVSSINQTKRVREIQDAVYAKFDGKFFNNRLSYDVGVRKARTKVSGYQPYTDGQYLNLKNPDGSVYYDPVLLAPVPINASGINGANRDINGNVIYNTDGSINRSNRTYATWSTDAALLSRIAAAGITIPAPYYARNATNTGFTTTSGTWQNNLDLAVKRLQTRSFEASRKDPITPSASLSYKATDSLDLKFGWSRETKLPNLEAGTSSAGYLASVSSSLNNDTGITTVTINNPDLQPEVTNSFNLSLGYYTKSGGSISVSGYYKKIKNEWDSISFWGGSEEGRRLGDSTGFPADIFTYYSTTFNAAKSSTRRGFEAEMRQNLGIFGSFAQNFDMFATYTYKTHGTMTYNPNIVNKLPGLSQDKYSFGLLYSGKRLQLSMRGTYATSKYERSDTVVSFGGQSYQLYRTYAPEYRINVEASYSFTKTYSAFVSINDFIRSDNNYKMEDLGTGVLPEYAKGGRFDEFGKLVTMGVTAKF